MNDKSGRDALQRVAEQYRAENYDVIIEPTGDQLPPFLACHVVDMIATRGTEKVVVKVKTYRSNLAMDAETGPLASLVNGRPGWRFDLVVVEPESPIRRATEKAQEPTEDQFRGMIARARAATNAGLNEMALVYAWGVLEGAMRRLRDDAELYGRTTPTQLLSTLYSNGFLNREDFDRAKEAWALRTQIVHGFVAPAVSPAMIDDILAIAVKVLGIPETQEMPAAG